MSELPEPAPQRARRGNTAHVDSEARRRRPPGDPAAVEAHGANVGSLKQPEGVELLLVGRCIVEREPATDLAAPVGLPSRAGIVGRTRTWTRWPKPLSVQGGTADAVVERCRQAALSITVGAGDLIANVPSANHGRHRCAAGRWQWPRRPTHDVDRVAWPGRRREVVGGDAQRRAADRVWIRPRREGDRKQPPLALPPMSHPSSIRAIPASPRRVTAVASDAARRRDTGGAIIGPDR
jgi:hypothetical protein